MKWEDKGIDETFENSQVNKRFQIVVSLAYKDILGKNYDSALSTIENFYVENFHEDINNNLKRKCDSWKATVFEEQGKLEEALALYKNIFCTMQPHYAMFIASSLDVARVLYQMGQLEEAGRQIENTLEIQVDGDAFDILQILELYTGILDSSGQSLSTHYRGLLEMIAGTLSVDLSEFDLSSTSDLSNAIIKICQDNRNANRRYSDLVLKIDEAEKQTDAIQLLKTYIEEEKFEFYRNLAVEELEEYEQAP